MTKTQKLGRQHACWPNDVDAHTDSSSHCVFAMFTISSDRFSFMAHRHMKWEKRFTKLSQSVYLFSSPLNNDGEKRRSQKNRPNFIIASAHLHSFTHIKSYFKFWTMSKHVRLSASCVVHVACLCWQQLSQKQNVPEQSFIRSHTSHSIEKDWVSK